MNGQEKAGVGPGIGLTDGLNGSPAQTATYAEATADIAMSLAGRARRLYELATGKTVSGEAPCSGYNPQGLLGHDHSGPPWGVCFRHPIAVFGGATKPASISQEPSGNTVWSNKWTLTANVPVSITCLWWVKPFPAIVDTPYSKLKIAYILYNTSGTSGAVDFHLQSRHPKTWTVIGTVDEVTGSIGATSEYIGELSTLLPVRPGWNEVEIVMKTANSTTHTFECYGLSANQVQRLTH